MLQMNLIIRRKVTRALQHSLIIPVILLGYVEGFKIPLSEKIPQKRAPYNLATEVLTGYGPYVFDRLCVSQSKNNKNRNQELENDMILFF